MWVNMCFLEKVHFQAKKQKGPEHAPLLRLSHRCSDELMDVMPAPAQQAVWLPCGAARTCRADRATLGVQRFLPGCQPGESRWSLFEGSHSAGQGRSPGATRREVFLRSGRETGCAGLVLGRTLGWGHGLFRLMGRGRTGAHQYLSARRRAKINKPGLQMRLSLEKGLPEPPLQNRPPRLVNKPSRHEEALCKGPPLRGTQWRTRPSRAVSGCDSAPLSETLPCWRSDPGVPGACVPGAGPPGGKPDMVLDPSVLREASHCDIPPASGSLH